MAPEVSALSFHSSASNLELIMVLFCFRIITTIITVNYIKSSPDAQPSRSARTKLLQNPQGEIITMYKVIAFMIKWLQLASLFFIRYLLQRINPSDFTFQKSIDVLIIVAFGGIGSVNGYRCGRCRFGCAERVPAIWELRMIFYAVALIAIMVFRPGGLLGNKEFTISGLLNRKAKKASAKKEEVQ